MQPETRLRFQSGQHELEGMLSLPGGANSAVVLCHPHPLYGGDMNNNVVVTVVRRLQQAGVATLRFNFRGVGASQGRHADGIGEKDDARAAVALVREQAKNVPIVLGGYSFGAIMALAAGHDHPDVSRLIAVAPPATMFDLSFLSACAKPTLFLLGDRDQFCPYTSLERIVTGLPKTSVLQRISGADHFFAGSENEIAAAAATFTETESIH